MDLRAIPGNQIYVVLFGSWLLCLIVHVMESRRIGRMMKGELDGMLLSVTVVAMTFCGGALGLVMFQRHYPWFVVSSFLGAALIPMAVTSMVRRSVKRGS